MIPVSPDLVLFGIQAALRIYAAGRQAYVDSTIGRALVLPLPRPVEFGVDVVVDWFDGHPDGIVVRDRTPLIQELLLKPEQNQDQLLTLYQLYLTELDPKRAVDQPVPVDDFVKLLTVKQLSKAEEGPSPLQRIGGTLLDVAVDYFAGTPGAVSQNRPEGRILLAFLKGADTVEFASTPARELAPRLMVGVLRAAGSSPELFAGGQREQLMITGLSTALAKTVNDKFLGSTKEERFQAADVVEAVAASLARGAVDTVLANPTLFLPGGGNAPSKVLQAVIEQVASLAIGTDKLTLASVVSESGLTRIGQAALRAVARNPDILPTGNPGLRRLVSEVALSLADNPLPAVKELAPSIVSLVLDRSAANLELLWQGDRSNPANNLLIVASRQTLEALSAAFKPGAKPPTFVQDQVLSILDAVFAEVEKNPQWVVHKVTGGNDVLTAALTAALEALKGHPPSELGAGLARDIVLASLTAVSAKLDFTRCRPGEAKAALTLVIREVLFRRRSTRRYPCSAAGRTHSPTSSCRWCRNVCRPGTTGLHRQNSLRSERCWAI